MYFEDNQNQLPKFKFLSSSRIYYKINSIFRLFKKKFKLEINDPLYKVKNLKILETASPMLFNYAL